MRERGVPLTFTSLQHGTAAQSGRYYQQFCFSFYTPVLVPFLRERDGRHYKEHQYFSLNHNFIPTLLFWEGGGDEV